MTSVRERTPGPETDPRIELEVVNCARCGGESWTKLFSTPDYLHEIEGTFSISTCNSCGLWAQMPRPSKASLPLLYPGEYGPHQVASADSPRISKQLGRVLHDEYGYRHLDLNLLSGSPSLLSSTKFYFMKNLRVGIDLIPHFVPRGRLLEIGSGNGWNLQVLKKLGWSDQVGIELVSSAVDACNKAGLNVVLGPAESLSNAFPDESFDVIISSMVIEHLHDPFSFINAVFRKLKPGGEFLFSTVQRDSLDFKIFKEFWALFDLPRHMIFFTKADLKEMLSPYFVDLKFYHQYAGVDFIRAAKWRKPEGRRFDQWLATANVEWMNRLAFALSLARWTGRLSIRCRKPNRGATG